MIKLSARDISRYWSKVLVKGLDECWLWQAGLNNKGYGIFTLANGKPGGRKHVASRISCFLKHGGPPTGKPFTLHSCDNPLCCNPGHVRWGSAKDNTADCIERGRKTAPPITRKGRKPPRFGEGMVNTKLTDEIAREVWRLHLMGHSNIEISEMTGVGKYPVNDLCRGRSFRHLPDAPAVDVLKQGGVRRGFNQFSR